MTKVTGLHYPVLWLSLSPDFEPCDFGFGGYHCKKIYYSNFTAAEIPDKVTLKKDFTPR